MAHRVKPWVPWIAAALLGCAGVAIAYLPPRGAPREPWFDATSASTSHERRRANALAAQWRAADQALRLARHREHLRPLLAARRDAGVAGRVVQFTTPLPEAVRARILAAIDTVWRDLDLGVSKVSIGLVVEGPPTETTVIPEAPSRPRSSGAAFLLPDSSDRHTCVAFAPFNYWTMRLASDPVSVPEARLREWVHAGLGVCGYYAALGTPGEEVGRWLTARQFDLALVPQWDATPASSRDVEYLAFVNAGRLPPWFWRDLYAYPFPAVGCVAGKASACRAAILSGAGASPAPGLVSTVQWWRRRSLVRGGTWASDLMREAGRSRARRFWSSPLPVDSAFRETIGTDIGEWTRAWQSEHAPIIRFGAAAPLGATALAALVAALSLAAAALRATRRQIG